MKKLQINDTTPSFPHWLRQRYLQVIMFTSLLLVNATIT